AYHHRHNAVLLVVPRELARDLGAVRETRLRKPAVARIAEALGRIAHGDQEFGEWRHRGERHASLKTDAARRRRALQRLAELASRDPVRREREDAIGDRRIEIAYVRCARHAGRVAR